MLESTKMIAILFPVDNFISFFLQPIVLISTLSTMMKKGSHNSHLPCIPHLRKKLSVLQ